MFVRIGGRQMYRWRAVGVEGEVLELLVQSRRDTAATRKLRRKLLKQYAMVPDERVADRHAAYGAALRDPDLTTPSTFQPSA
jgi:putative transposase